LNNRRFTGTPKTRDRVIAKLLSLKDTTEILEIYFVSLFIFRSGPRPGRFAPGEKSRYPLDRDWVGPRVGLDCVEKILDKYQIMNSDPSAVQPVDNRYADCAMRFIMFIKFTYTKQLN
jgi:hypothetical protein